MKKTLALISCFAMVFVVHVIGAAGAGETKKFKDKQIEELSKKYFYYSNVDGKESLTLTTAPSKEWYEKASDYLCENAIVQLTEEYEAISIPNSPLILAFLECPAGPASRGYEYDAIVAFFDRKNLNEPLCFSHLDLEADYYGAIRSVEARKAGNGAFHVVVVLTGADGGDHWTSFLFLHLDMKCKVTVLSKFYASHGITHGADQPGREIGYRFVDDKTVEVTTDHLVPTNVSDEKVVKTTSEKYNLEELYKDPKSRVFPSKAEKALALVKTGFDVNTRDDNGKTLLMLAAEDGSSEVVEALLDKGADINAKTKDGYTALMAAAYGGKRTTVTTLLDKGADVNAKDDNGWTALMSAARTGHRNAAEVLLDRGADVNAKTKGGWTALKAAQGEEHTVIVALLKACGAKE
jgi:hypothetical protein